MHRLADRGKAFADLAMGTEWAQKTVTLQSKPRGCHVITKELYKQIPEIHEFEIGMANIWRASPNSCVTLPSFSGVLPEFTFHT